MNTKKHFLRVFPAVAILWASALAAIGSVQAAGGHDDHAAPPPKASLPASFHETAEKPNAPSLARVEDGRKVKAEDWEDPAICGSCHTVQYQGWNGSMHSNSFKDPIFQAEWALAEKQVGNNIGNLCAGCHTPPGMLSGTVKFDPDGGEHGSFSAPPVAEKGVSCDVCHTITGTSFEHSEVIEHGNGSYIANPGEVKHGPLKDAKSPYHKTEYSDHHKSAKFCANCHNIFNPVNQFPLERTYDEWKYSVYAQNDVQCQDCHMVPVETAVRVADEMKPARELKDHGLGGYAAIGAEKPRELLHGHAFVGGNAVITAALGDEEGRKKAGIAIKRLRNVAELDVQLNSVAGQGALKHLRVKVTNQRAGHHIPTSLTFVRELWLDVQVLDQDGKEIFRSGALDDHREVDPNAMMFKAYAVDKDAKPAKFIWTVERFERRTTIPPKGFQYGDYYFNVPESATQLTVRARLNYRSASQHFIDHLLGEGKVEVPTIQMEDIETVYKVADMSLVSRTDHLTLSATEKEAAEMLEKYFGPEEAMQDISKLTQACGVCHGSDGVSPTDDVPNLAGQNELYLLSAMRSYKSGVRPNSQMKAMLKNVNDDQLGNLAKHYSAMK